MGPRRYDSSGAGGAATASGRTRPGAQAAACTEEQARDFIANGMLLNVMLAMQAPQHLDEGPLGSLTQCAFGEALDAVPGR